MMPILNLENISYRYKNAQGTAVSGITYAFEEGKVYAIVGPSGSGKSTLLSLLAGLDSPTEGGVFFQGESLAGLDLDRYRRESVSMIFQAFHLFPLLTVMENVCFPMELRKVAPKDAKPYYSCFHIREDTRGFLYTDKMEFHVIELPKLPLELKEDCTGLELWAKFINAERKEEFDMIAGRDPYIDSAYQQLQVISQDKQKRMEYEAREKAVRDYNQGMYEAEERGKCVTLHPLTARGETGP